MRGRGLKGNAVRIGNSSRCCKFPGSNTASATSSGNLLPLAPKAGKGAGTGTSQKTCPCLLRIRFCGEWRWIPAVFLHERTFRTSQPTDFPAFTAPVREHSAGQNLLRSNDGFLSVPSPPQLIAARSRHTSPARRAGSPCKPAAPAGPPLPRRGAASDRHPHGGRFVRHRGNRRHGKAGNRNHPHPETRRQGARRAEQPQRGRCAPLLLRHTDKGLRRHRGTQDGQYTQHGKPARRGVLRRHTDRQCPEWHGGPRQVLARQHGSHLRL